LTTKLWFLNRSAAQEDAALLADEEDATANKDDDETKNAEDFGTAGIIHDKYHALSNYGLPKLVAFSTGEELRLAVDKARADAIEACDDEFDEHAAREDAVSNHHPSLLLQECIDASKYFAITDVTGVDHDVATEKRRPNKVLKFSTHDRNCFTKGSSMKVSDDRDNLFFVVFTWLRMFTIVMRWP
jgi:hypothetical protein